MTTSIEQTAFLVNLLDAEGDETGRAVLVYIEYQVEVDWSYGEDADGQRGERRIEYTLLRSWIEPGDLRTLTDREASQVLADAERIFYGRQKQW